MKISIRSGKFPLIAALYFLIFWSFAVFLYAEAGSPELKSDPMRSVPGEPIDEKYCDVLVVGAGSAGIPAAVQSGRAGAQTILLEMSGQCGGTTVLAGIRYPGLFHAWGKQIIAGIGWELVQKAVELNGDKMPDFSVDHGPHHWKLSIPVNTALYALLAEELCLNAGVEIRYYETPCLLEKTNGNKQTDPNQNTTKKSNVTQTAKSNPSPKESNLDSKKSNPGSKKNNTDPKKSNPGSNWKVTTCSQGKFRTIYCREIIDCTGNGSVAELAGAKRVRAIEAQPGSIFYTIDSGIDKKTADRAKIQALYKKALAQGRLHREDMFGGVERFLWYPRPAGNRTYVYGADNSTPQGRTDADIKGRQSALRALRFIKTLPGGENARLVEISQQTGVRETWRVMGRYVITAEDYRDGRVWDDSIAYAFYPIDIHTRDGVAPQRLKQGVVPTIPYRALIADHVEHLLVAGRCMSSDREASSALRVQSICMAGGQAAGAGAALAAKNGIAPENVDLRQLKDLLKKNGAIVPEK